MGVEGRSVCNSRPALRLCSQKKHGSATVLRVGFHIKDRLCLSAGFPGHVLAGGVYQPLHCKPGICSRVSPTFPESFQHSLVDFSQTPQLCFYRELRWLIAMALHIIQKRCHIHMDGAVCRYSYWRFYPNSRSQRRINDVKALHDLLSHHIDDLEDVMAALKDTMDTPYSLSGILPNRSSAEGGEPLVHAPILFVWGCVSHELKLVVSTWHPFEHVAYLYHALAGWCQIRGFSILWQRSVASWTVSDKGLFYTLATISGQMHACTCLRQNLVQDMLKANNC